MAATANVPSLARMSTGRVVAGVMCVVVFHIVTVFLLYGLGRQIVAAGLPGSFTVFVLPMMLSYLGYYLLLRAGKPRVIPCWVGAFLLTMLSLCLSLPLPFDLYGS